MPDEQVRIDIVADDHASKPIDAIAKKIDKLDEPVDIPIGADTKEAERDVAGLLKKVAGLARDPANVLLATNAAKIAGDIHDLIADLDKLDANDPTVEVKTDQINKLQGELDQVETKLRDINGTPLDLDTSKAKAGIDDVGKSLDGAKSVSANAIGNMSQDLGALGGVAGSAGVAIGQMGEYFADAAGTGEESIGKIAKNFLTVAGPLTVATIGVGLLTQAFTDMQAAAAETKTFNKERVRAFADALEDAALSATELREALEKGGEGPGIFVRIADQTHNVDRSVAKLFHTFQEFNQEVARGTKGYDEWSAAQVASAKRAGAGADEVSQLTDALADARDGTIDVTQVLVGLSPAYRTVVEAALAYGSAVHDAGEGSKDAAFQTRFYGQAVADAGKATAFATKAEERAAKVHDDYAEGQKRIAEGARELAAAQKSQDWGAAELQGALTAMGAFTDAHFALVNIAQQSDAAVATLTDSVKENGKQFDLSTTAGKKNADALEEVARALDTQFAAAYDDANGNLDTFKSKATDIANTTLTRLQRELGLSDQQTADLAASLGLLPADLETRYKLSGDEEARIRLGLLQSSIDSLPKDTQLQIAAQIAMGDYVGALATAQDYYNRHPLTAKVELQVSTAKLTAAQMAAINSERNVTVGGSMAPATSVVNVTQHLPRGWRGNALAEAQASARRSGGLYRRVRR